jgi:hypothetical protein
LPFFIALHFVAFISFHYYLFHYDIFAFIISFRFRRFDCRFRAAAIIIATGHAIAIIAMPLLITLSLIADADCRHYY